MKKNTTYSLRTMLGILSVILLVVVAAACSSDNDSSVESLGKTEVSLEVEGIRDTRMASVSKTALKAEKNTADKKAMDHADFLNFQGFDARAIMAEVPSSVKAGVQQQSTARSTGGGKASKGLLAATMENGVKYYLVLKDPDEDVVYTGTHEAGVHSAFEIEAGIDYDWYAFSVNESSLPAVNGDGEVDAANIANKDVLIASGTINPVQDEENQLPIAFKRNTIKYNVAINARGLFGRVNDDSEITLEAEDGSGMQPVLQTGDLDIFTGDYSNVQAITGNYNGASNDATYGETVRTGAFYSVAPAQIQEDAFTVKLEELDLMMVDDDDLESGESLDRTFAPATIATNNDAFTSEIGYEYDINIQLVESGVKVKDIVWARTNLTYRDSNPDKYIFRRHNETESRKDVEYWNWKSATPTGNPGEVDACSQVYPEGTWRMPTAAESNSLGELDDKNESYGLLFGAAYSSGYDLDSGETPNDNYPDLSQNLYFTMYGYRNPGGGILNPNPYISGSPIGLLIGIVGTGSGQYWTSTESGNEAEYLYWKFESLLLLLKWSDEAEIKSDDKDQGRNMRCVRAI